MATENNGVTVNSSDPLLASIRAKVAAMKQEPKARLPSSKPLQVFLLIALVLTGAAYVVNQMTEFTTEDQRALARQPDKLRQRLRNQNAYAAETALGAEAERNQKYSDAVLHYRRAVSAQPTAQGYLNLGSALLAEGNPDMAFAQFKQALRLNPQLEEIYLTWGGALSRQDKLDEAIQLYQDGLRANPKFMQVNYNFALVLEQKQTAALVNKNQAEARMLATDALKHFAAAEHLGLDVPAFWASYGMFLNREGKFSEAEGTLTKAVAEQPNSGASQFQLALALDKQGKYAEAIAHYESALALIPDDPATLNNLAVLYATATNPAARSSKMAIMLATRASDAMNSQDARYMDTLARAYAADGDFFQAIAWEDKAIHRAQQLSENSLLAELQPRFNLFVQHKAE